MRVRDVDTVNSNTKYHNIIWRGKFLISMAKTIYFVKRIDSSAAVASSMSYCREKKYDTTGRYPTPPGQSAVLGEPNEYVSMYNNCELLWYIVYMYVHTYKHMYSESMKQTIWKTNIIYLVVAMEPILCRLYLLILLLLLLLFWLYLRFGHGWTVAFFQMAWAWGDVPVSIWI